MSTGLRRERSIDAFSGGIQPSLTFDSHPGQAVRRAMPWLSKLRHGLTAMTINKVA
jgi:hypothetical protein